MKVTLHYTDGSESEKFRVNEISHDGDIAMLNGIIHTDVERIVVRTEVS